MGRKETFTVDSTDNKNKLHTVCYIPDEAPKGIVQISHGMVEYVERFESLAQFLCGEGFVVIGNDHLGHGKSAACDDDLGYFGQGKSALVAADLYEVTKYAKDRFGKELPYILFGHSMGSFMARRYAMEYGDELNGLILSGTGYTPGPVLLAGKLVAGIIGCIHGERYRSKMVKNMAFGTYNKRIPNAQTPWDWLTKDEKIIKKYQADKFCTFDFTINGYLTLFDALGFIQNKSNVDRIPKDLPIYFIAGEEDPVGNYGKGVKAVCEDYKKAGIKKVSIKLYPGDRHELTNELDKDTVYRDILEFVYKCI